MNSRNDKLVTAKFFEFFFPTILMAAAGSLSIIIDSVIVGNVLGSEELAAMNLVMPLSMCITTISAFFGVGGSIAISRLKGAMEHKKADLVFSTIVAGWLLLCVLSLLLGTFFSDEIAAFFSAGSGLTDFVAQYMKVYLLGAPFSFAMFIFPYIIKADGKPQLCSVALVISNAVNLCMDIVYMKYLHMGLGGGALATITGYFVGLLICLVYIKSPIRTLHFSKIKLSDFKCYADMFKYGISSILGQGLMFGKMLILNTIISSIIGKSGLVAFSVCMSCLSFVSMFIAGASQTMMPLAASFSTCKDQTALKITIRKSINIIMGCCLAASVLFELMPSVIMRFYGVTAPQEIAIGVSAIRIFSISFVGIGFTFFYMYYMQTIKRTTFSLQICVLEGFLVIVPMAYVMANLFGVKGIWISYILNEVISFLFITLRSRSIVKKSNGKYYSIFLYQEDSNEKYETTVDLKEENQIQKTMDDIQEYTARYMKNQGSESLRLCVKSCINLLQHTCLSTKKRSSILDITIHNENGKTMLEFKNSGQPITLMLEDNEVKENMEIIKQQADTFDYSLLLGMNYLKVSLS